MQTPHITPNRVPRLAAILLAIVVAVIDPHAAAAQKRETRFVAPTDQTVTTRIEESFGDTPYQVIWIWNGSTVPIRVYSVTLRNCENIKEQCDPYPLNLRVGPGDHAMLRRVDPKDANASFSFRFTFGWRADSSEAVALHVLADNGVAKAQRLLTAQSAADSDQKAAVGVHDVNLDPDDIAALGTRIVGIRAEPDSIHLRVGQILPLSKLHILAVDAQGGLLGRVWGYNLRIAGTVVTMRADTIVAQKVGHTKLDFHLTTAANPLGVTVPLIVTPADTAK